MKLGALSEKYEVGKRGTATVGWDSRGLASYGRYQIASGTGTLRRFLEWCFAQDGWYRDDVYDYLHPLLSSAKSKTGPFARTWRARVQKIPLHMAQAEHEFIRETHYERARMDIWGGAFQALVIWPALQQVLWSTAVQHGPASAVKIFHQAWSKTWDFENRSDVDAFISAIYRRRGLRLSKLTEAERRAVLNRYRHEERDAHGLLEKDVASSQ